jgi:hypothetical protein
VASATDKPEALGEVAPDARPTPGGTAPAGIVAGGAVAGPLECVAGAPADRAGPVFLVVGLAPVVDALVRTGVFLGHQATFAATTTAITATMTLTRSMVRFLPPPKIEPLAGRRPALAAA